MIVDVDDTLCDVSGIRHLYAVPDNFLAFTHASRNCPPRKDVLDWCHHHVHVGGCALLVVTGRSDEFRDLTTQWLEEHLSVPYAGLWMRPRGNYGSNAKVKRQIHANLSRSFDVREAIDDDPLIVEMWTELGITATLVSGVNN